MASLQGQLAWIEKYKPLTGEDTLNHDLEVLRCNVQGPFSGIVLFCRPTENRIVLAYLLTLVREARQLLHD